MNLKKLFALKFINIAFTKEKNNMIQNRRVLVLGASVVATTYGFLPVAKSQPSGANQPGTIEDREKFISNLDTKALISRWKYDRFLDPVFYLLEPFTWTPNAPNVSNIQPVTVPKGFVSDLASVPRVFYSLYRPDGEYSQAAVVHDYLYWTQERSKKETDLIFKIAMEDLELSRLDVSILYAAVALLGNSAWVKNRQLKAAGEQRILKVFPDPKDVKTRWVDWKRSPSVFK
jgi:Protein of unknown function (DUF1353)